MNIRLKRSAVLAVALALVIVLGSSVAFASVTGTTTSNLNKRSSPTTSAAKAGTISKGSTITVVSKLSDGDTYGSITVSGDWYKLSDGNFVSADYVKLNGTLDEEDEDELPPDDDEEETPPEDDGDTDIDEVTDDGEGEVTIDDDVEEVTVDDDTEVPEESDSEDETLPDDVDEEEVPDEETETQVGLVNATSLNLRSVPSSTGSTVLAKLARNTSVTIEEEYADGDVVGSITVKGAWYKVTYNGKTGYVSADYIKIGTSESSATTTVTVPIKHTKTVYKTSQKVTVYKLPTTVASTDGTLASGTTVTVQKTIADGASFTGLSVAVSGKWYMIGTSRYILAKYVTSSSSTSTSSVEITLGTTLVTTTAVRQRAKPSTSATQLAKLEKGAKIVIVGAVLDGETYNGTKVSGNWIQIKGGGFVSADYVALP